MNATTTRASSGLSGLSAGEARRRLLEFGPNAMPDVALHPLRNVLAKFWAPVPWMLEATILLELVLGKFVEAAIIAALLVFNAALGFFQESRAQATLAALKSRLALDACVRRDNAWVIVPAAELVAGDVVKLSLGGVLAADVHITAGEVLLDQSMLTGESIPVEAGSGAPPNLSARRMWSARSNRRCCVWCAILPHSTASSSSCSWPMLLFCTCRPPTSSRWASPPFSRRYPWRCRPRLPLPPRSARGLLPRSECCPPGFPRSMKRHPWTSYAPIRPAPSPATSSR